MKNKTVLLYVGGFFMLTLGVALIVGQLLFSAPGFDVPKKHSNDIRVATYNVHYIVDRANAGRWSLEGWEARKEPLAEAVSALQADIIGFQEMETFSGGGVSEKNLARKWLLTTHPEYTAGATGDPAEFPSTQPIFFRHDRFSLLDQGWFFFSETPDGIYSHTYNGSYPAFASWVELTDRQSEQTFKVVNIHTDFSSYSNRRQSLELVRDRITPWLVAGETVMVIGDFNAWLGSRLHAILEDAGLTFAPVWSATYHFDRGLHLFPAIDHVSFSDDFTTIELPVVLQQRFQGMWPSDHYPVVVDLEFATD